ncbi:MAG: hypothetical protein ABIE07_12040 [Candidatus Zixiibacteriota bacterium]
MATRRKTRKVRPMVRRTRVKKVARVWTREEISFLRKYYRFHDTSWCARQLGRTVYSVRYKACDLSIRKANPSNWKNPPKVKMAFGHKVTPTTRRKTTRAKKNTRWAATRKNNRRSRW